MFHVIGLQFVHFCIRLVQLSILILNASQKGLQFHMGSEICISIILFAKSDCVYHHHGIFVKFRYSKFILYVSIMY